MNKEIIIIRSRCLWTYDSTGRTRELRGPESSPDPPLIVHGGAIDLGLFTSEEGVAPMCIERIQGTTRRLADIPGSVTCVSSDDSPFHGRGSARHPMWISRSTRRRPRGRCLANF
jgi:hypothetical protein